MIRSVFAAMLLPTIALAGDCGVVFRSHGHVQHVAPVVSVPHHGFGVGAYQQFASPYVFQVGADTIADSIAERIAAKVMQRVAVASTSMAEDKPAKHCATCQTQPMPTPQRDSFEPVRAAGSVLEAKCAKCHSGENPKGGVRLDLDSVSDATSLRIIDMLLNGNNVPGPMQALVSGLSDKDKGDITAELLRRSPATKE